MIYKFTKSTYRFFVSIDRTIKRKYWTWRSKMACHSYQLPLHVNFRSQFTKNTYLGKNNHFNGFEIAGTGKVTFGDNFHSGKNCKVINSFHNYQGASLPYDRTYIVKDVEIGDNVWLGDDVTILGGVSIGEGAIIQAGSVVVRSIPRLAIAGGHPAEVFKYRDSDHYERVKTAGKFI